MVGACGTAASAAAIRWAADEADRRLAQLVVVQAWQRHPTSAKELALPGRTDAHQGMVAQVRLRRWVESVIGPTSAELCASHGGPFDELLAAAADADLVVVGHSVHGVFGRLLHGSVDTDLSGTLQCPVVVVPGAAR